MCSLILLKIIFYVFNLQDGVSLKQAYNMYKVYCDESLLDYRLAMYKFREELKNYFEEFHDITRVDGKQIRSYYKGFLKEKIYKLTNWTGRRRTSIFFSFRFGRVYI